MILVTICSFLGGVSAQSTLEIATIERPPFAFKTNSGNWSGYSIELMTEIAERSGLSISFREETVFAQMLKAVEHNEVAAAIANISVTSQRETIMDFSQPIFNSGLQILVRKDRPGISFLKTIWKSGIMLFLGIVLLILLVFAHLLWFFERHGDAKHDYFRDDYKGGIWDAFWWAFIVATMGGFEKERPVHLMGKILAMTWIVSSLFFVSTFTAKITTALTIAQLQTDISSYHDLHGKHVGAAVGTTISQFLVENSIPFTEFADFSDTLTALEKGDVEVIVGSAAVSQYYAHHAGKGKVRLTGDVFAPDSIAIAMPEGSDYYEIINQTLVALKEDSTLKRLQVKYFGQ